MYQPPASPAQYPAHTTTPGYGVMAKDVSHGGYVGAAQYLPAFGSTGHGAYSGIPTFGAAGQTVNQGTYHNVSASYPTTYLQDSNTYSSHLHPVVSYHQATAPEVHAQAPVVDYHPVAETKKVSSSQTFKVHLQHRRF